MDERTRAGPHEQDLFLVNVKYRQNATWQGTVAWADGKQEVNFRSALELLKIIDSALAENHPEDN